MPGELAEAREVRVPRLEVPDIRLVLDDGNAVDHIWWRTRCIGRLANTALRRRDSVTNTKDRGACVEIVQIPWIEVVLLNRRLLILVEETRHPVVWPSGLGGQPQFLRPGPVDECLVARHEHPRIHAIQGGVKRESIV